MAKPKPKKDQPVNEPITTTTSDPGSAATLLANPPAEGTAGDPVELTVEFAAQAAATEQSAAEEKPLVEGVDYKSGEVIRTVGPAFENPDERRAAVKALIDSLPLSDDKTPAPPAGDGVVVTTAVADVGSAPPPAASNPAEAFAQAIQDRAAQDKLQSLNLIGYSPELQAALVGYFENFTGTPVTKSLLKFVLRYSNEMSVHAPTGGGVGEGLQRQFFNEFTTFVNIGPADFRQGMNLMLAIVKESAAGSGGFSGFLPMRFLPNVNLISENVKALEALMHLLQSTADVSMRAMALKQIDLERALRFGFSPEGKQRLVMFYRA